MRNNRPIASSPSRNTSPATVAPPPATDDEILGIASPRKNLCDPRQLEFDFDADADAANADGLRTAGVSPAPLPSAHANTAASEPAHLRATFESNPDLRAAWHDAHAYRESFGSPEAAREATALDSDLNRMDALFFSHRPEDHVALARNVASLDPAAFASLTRAMNEIATESQRPGDTEGQKQGSTEASAHATQEDSTAQSQNRRQDAAATNTNATAQAATNPDTQLAFLHAANASAVEGVIGAIESQVERLLPEGVAKNARTRVVGEIYRELDATLRSNPQFAAQLRDAFRSGSLDDAHHRAIVSLLTGRARQALPAVAKRVLNEWTSTIVSASNERRPRQRTAERRVDIAGSGGAASDGRRAMSPRDLDYLRVTDADILNL